MSPNYIDYTKEQLKKLRNSKQSCTQSEYILEILKTRTKIMNYYAKAVAKGLLKSRK